MGQKMERKQGVAQRAMCDQSFGARAIGAEDECLGDEEGIELKVPGVSELMVQNYLLII